MQLIMMLRTAAVCDHDPVHRRRRLVAPVTAPELLDGAVSTPARTQGLSGPFLMPCDPLVRGQRKPAACPARPRGGR